jgi:hypothetical protein
LTQERKKNVTQPLHGQPKQVKVEGITGRQTRNRQRMGFLPFTVIDYLENSLLAKYSTP